MANDAPNQRANMPTTDITIKFTTNAVTSPSKFAITVEKVVRPPQKPVRRASDCPFLKMVDSFWYVY